MRYHRRPRWLRLPRWTAHPVFGVLALLALAIGLIVHGEPQPSSRPSGTSVGVSSGTASAQGSATALLVLRGTRLERVQQGTSRPVRLPAGAMPRSLLTSRGLSVVLAVVGSRQRAYAISPELTIRDLGYADAVIPAVRGSAAVLIESSLTDPGSLPTASATRSASASPPVTPGSSSAGLEPGQLPLADYAVRGYDSSGRPLTAPQRLPRGFQVATDTGVGLVVWQPVNRQADDGMERESLSAAALLVRGDGSLRPLGPVHPLAADADNLLVWDVSGRRFGVMPLQYVTSTATSTVSGSPSASGPAVSDPAGSDPAVSDPAVSDPAVSDPAVSDPAVSDPAVSDPAGSGLSRPASATPSVTPTVVAGTRWFLPTRGMLLVTGPAAFDAGGDAFAVYAQVGSRRRLMVAQLANLDTDQVEVLVLAQPPVRTSPVPSSSLILPSPSGSTSTSPAPTSTAPVLAADGYPIPAPLTPLWQDGLAIGVAPDGTVIGYRPGESESSQLDLGLAEPAGTRDTLIRALAPAP